jgi:hypothetical protein
MAATVPMASAAADDASEPNVFHACYEPSGKVYRIKEPGLLDECKSPAHVPFDWNQQGPLGPKGDPGEPGLPGPAGADGVSGWEPLWVQAQVAPNTEQQVLILECPAGKKMTGGGYAAGTGMVIRDSHPNVRPGGGPSTFGEAWFVRVSNPTGETLLLTVYGICATV